MPRWEVVVDEQEDVAYLLRGSAGATAGERHFARRRRCFLH